VKNLPDPYGFIVIFVGEFNKVVGYKMIGESPMHGENWSGE